MAFAETAADARASAVPQEREVRIRLDLCLNVPTKRLPWAELQKAIEEAVKTLDYVTFVDAWVTGDSDA